MFFLGKKQKHDEQNKQNEQNKHNEKNEHLEKALHGLRDELHQLRNEMPTTITEWSNASWTDFANDSAAGLPVSAETAKRSSAVSACVKLIAGSVAALPLHIYLRTTTGRERVDHPLWWLLNESPYATLTARSFWDWMVSSLLLRGDGLAQLIRNSAGVVQSIMPLHRDCVVIQKRDDHLVYLVNDGVKSYGLHQDDVLHFAGFGFNGLHGESVIRFAARQAVGTALAADEFSGEFFKNGATPSLVITYPENVAPKKEQQDFLREQIEERHSGSGKRHKPLLLVNGGKLEPVSLTAEDAQLLQTRQFQVLEIARAFGVPPHMIGETSASTSWGSGIEQMSIAYVRYTLGAHLDQINQELNRKLWPRSLKYFVEFNRDALLAGDSKTESEFFSKALGGPSAQGWMTINEVRRLKNLPPLDGGDKLIFASQKNTPTPSA